MSSHILTPLVALVRRLRPASPRPVDLSFEVTPGMRGKPLFVYDDEGNLIGTIGNQPHSDDAMRMIG